MFVINFVSFDLQSYHQTRKARRNPGKIRAPFDSRHLLYTHERTLHVWRLSLSEEIPEVAPKCLRSLLLMEKEYPEFANAFRRQNMLIRKKKEKKRREER